MTTTNTTNNKPLPQKEYDSPSEDEDDDDTVIGTCLHCNCPPPPRSERAGSGSTFAYTPCPASDPSALSASCNTRSNEGATRVQVSCDDCRSFICDGCHWCHEFQANHEIRVCDRCDAFYCRACDEMDQCEDCSEVVCNTCSTLMSCKFCGCGLCEDCATACGRCGIVLCARDAKFAVECDTCKMSYCLVCLASGTKDPCVRCGHRPSKRVEQLVHLRLKSIYKAFKQSGASSSGGPGPPMQMGDTGSNSGGGDDKNTSGGSNNSRDTSSIYRGKYSSALRSLTENESLRNMEGSSTNFDQSMANEVAAVLQTASNSMSMVGGDDRRSRGRRVASHPPPPFSADGTMKGMPSSRVRTSTSPLWRKTREEIEAAHAAAEASAEAAAAALLAELDEEETNGPKKSKKKKKKGAKKKDSSGAAVPEEDAEKPSTAAKPADFNLDSKSAASTKKQGTKADKIPIDDESSDEEEMILEQLVGMNKSSKPPKKEREKQENKEAPPAVVAEPSPPPPPPPPVEGNPDLDKELAVLISNNDEDGLEEFLTNLKGVPGLSVLRKATKKALKKMKDDKHPELKPQRKAPGDKPTKKEKAKAAAVAVAAPQASANLNPATTAGSQHGPLLTVVSRTQSAVGATKGGAANIKSVPATARAECVMHMSPTVVGWVIGKGGQRIRDMMEESGAKIWIDQESMGDNDARVVYVSGKRANVDVAVKMVKDLISKAPVSASAAAVPVQGDAPAISVASQPVKAPSKSPSPVVSATAPVADAAPSFAAAASQATKQPASVAPTRQAPKPKKAHAPGWSNPDATNVSQQPLKPAAAAAPPVANPFPRTVANSTVESSQSMASMMNASRQHLDIVRSEINCDPQFIALLLGRDGLAAKSIQTESGASLHINQTVAPGKIGISGRAENVAKAEQLIHGVLKYRDEQVKQEQALRAAPVSNMRPDVSLNQGTDPYANDLRIRQANISAMPSIQLHNLQRHDDMQFQNQRPPQVPNAGMVDRVNLPPGYDAYQRPPSFGSSEENLLHRQSPLQRHIPHPQPPRPTSASSIVDSSMHRQQQEWGQLPQSHQPNQYSTMSQFSDSTYMGSNIYASGNNPLPHQDRRSTLPPAFDQNRGYLQNLDAPRPPQAASSRLDSLGDYMHQGNPRQQNVNGWGLSNMNGGANTGDISWNQSQIAPQAAPRGIPAFATQHSLPLDPAPSLSDNLFLNQQPASNQSAPVLQSAAKAKIDDSQFVDNMFNSLGDSGKNGDGLLDLNSLSLGGLQQGATWGSSIGGWGGLLPNDDSSTLLNNNRRGSGFEANFGNQSQR